MRDGIEYECAVSLLIDQETHVFETMKDNTKNRDGDSLFDGRNDMIKVEDGRQLMLWANRGIKEEIKISPELEEYRRKL